MPFLTRGKSAIVSDCENIIAVQGSEDFNNGKACIVLREAWLGGPLPSGAACRIRKCAKGYAILIYRRLQHVIFTSSLLGRAAAALPVIAALIDSPHHFTITRKKPIFAPS